jgi:hypothetical protein
VFDVRKPKSTKPVKSDLMKDEKEKTEPVK